MTELGAEKDAEVGSAASRESPEGALAGWISGIQWGPYRGWCVASGSLRECQPGEASPPLPPVTPSSRF